MLLFSFGAGLEGAAVAREDAPGEGQDSSACQAVRLVVVFSCCWFSESSNIFFDRKAIFQAYCNPWNCSLSTDKTHCISQWHCLSPWALSLCSHWKWCGRWGVDPWPCRRETNPSRFKCELQVSSLGKDWYSLWRLISVWYRGGFRVLGTSQYHTTHGCQ